jgi:hypothetical protein
MGPKKKGMMFPVVPPNCTYTHGWPYFKCFSSFKMNFKANILLFESSGKINRLIGTLMILNTSTTHWCINGFIDELLSLLHNPYFLSQTICLSHIMRQKA